MFGYCDLQWQSVISPAMPPRPIVEPLARGYRRIPIMQIGADIFCDTKLIASEIASLSNKPELAMETCGTEIAQYSDYVDTVIFMAGLQSVDPRKMLFSAFRLFSPLQAIKFIKDRAGVQKTSSVKRLGRECALKLLDEHFHDMINPFLFGDSPSIADFSAYHCLWFKNVISGGEQFETSQRLKRWFQAMSKFSHDTRVDSSKADAFATASNNEPRVFSDDMKRLSTSAQ